MRGALPLTQDCGSPTKLPDMVFVITKHLLKACGHRPVDSSPRAWALLEVQPDSSGDDEEAFSGLTPLSPAIKPL